jgi:RNA recognition motif-containing protein
MREERGEKGENGERKGGEGNNRWRKKKGFLHRLDMETTSFFFTNIPPESTTVELWKRFGRFGRVGEVYIPNRLDKQGRRFGFVKFRDVRDATELLRAISDIWVGSFKLRVNKARFRRDEEKREPDQAQPVVRKEVNVAPPAH